MEAKLNPERPSQKHLPLILCLFAVILFYALFLSSGTFNHSGTTTIYYAYLAESFLNGHIYLPIEPDPNLLATDNPYDPLTRIQLERVGIITPMDFSLYKGNFYLYFGPVPALILAIIQLFSIGPVGDIFVAFAFVVGIFLVQSWFLLTLWDHYFRTISKWTLYLAIFLGGSIWPIALLRHYDDYARIYEAAIAGGQFFLMSGLLVLFIAVTKPAIRNWRLILAGSLWALAIGTRNVLAVPIGFMTILAAFWLIKIKNSFFEKASNLVCLGMPMALSAAGLAWYNWARFGTISETGFSYALAGQNLQAHYNELFSGSYIIPNLYNYLLNPPALILKFPFITMLKGMENPTLPFYHVPDFYYAQPITGLLYIFPFGLFAIVPLILVLPNLFKGKLAEISLEGNNDQLLAWTALMLSGSFLIAFSILMFFFWEGTRYLGDFGPTMIILSVLGFWQGCQFLAHRWFAKNLYMYSGVILASISILMSTLLAISINPGLADLIAHGLPFLR